MAGSAYKKTCSKLIVFLFILLGITLVHSPSVFADNAEGPFISKPMRDQMVDYQQLTYTLACLPTSTTVNYEYALPGDSPMENLGTNDMVFASNDQLKNKKYLDQGVLANSIGRGSMYDNEAMSCDSGKDFGFVWPFTNFGKNNLIDFFCTLPGVYHNLTGGKGRTVSGGSNKAACVAGSKFTNGKSFYVAKAGTNLRAQAKAEFATTKRGKIASQPLTPAKKYLQYWMTFDKVCGAQLTTEYPKNSDPAANNGAIFRIPVVNQNGDIVEYIANTGGPSTDGKRVVLDATHPYPGDTTCGQLAVGMRKLAPEYSKYLMGPGRNDPGATDGTGIPENEPDEEEAASGTSCAIDGIGWIICPVMNFLAEANEKAFGFLQSLLGVRPSLVQDDATVNAWSRFRDLANVAFVIAFLVIIYSQLTSVGISNYGIKKMLPKIAIAAILVNLSLFICQLLVDVSNIAGASLYSFIVDLVPRSVEQLNDGKWTSIMTGLLAVGVSILLIVAVFTAPIVLLALGLVLFILIARQAFILILVIISPLAFVAYLLPNTEDLFKKWWKALSAMLLVYPIIAVVFGASTLASNILMEIAEQGSGDDSQLLAIVALTVMAIPLFAIPSLLKGAMAGAGSIGARLQGMADKTQGRASAKGKARFGESAAGQYLKYRQQKNATNRALARGGQSTGSNKNPLNWRRNATAAAMRGFNNSKASGAFGDRLSAAGTAIADKEWDEEVGRQKTSMTSMDHSALLAVMRDKNATAERRAAAAGTIMSRGYREGHLQALEAAHELRGAGDTAMSGIQKQMAHDMKEKPWALSDSAIGQLQTGNYGSATTSINPETGQEETRAALPTITQDIATRTGTKLSAASLASMNPDELKRMHKLAMNGQLSDSQLANFRSAINEARSNDLYKNNIKPEASALFDDVLRSPNNAATHEEALQLNVQHDQERATLQGQLSDMETQDPSMPREP